ncbi:MAG: phenylalanine--tRNA ligase subunit alpha, partial [Micrococcales bacterium]|nr:phenylalanine--tRNA ligase subunit alpha [Micrococcales bacterium]
MSEISPISAEAVDTVISDALKIIEAATNLAELKTSKSTTIGENSAIASLSSKLGKLPADQKADAGKLITNARNILNAAFA